MLTYKFHIREARNNSLFLRLTNNRKSAEVNLGLQMTPAQLEDALATEPKMVSGPERRAIRWYKEKLMEYKCELLENGWNDIDVAEAKRWVETRLLGRHFEEEDPTRGEFVRWYKRFMETHPEDGRTRKAYEHTLARMGDYDPQLNDRKLTDISVAWLEGFESFMAKTMGVNSRNHHFRNVRAVIKYAIRNDADMRNPFDRMRLRREETVKRSLTIAQLRKLLQCEVEEYAEVYRDMFALTFMLIGINPIDLYNLKEMTADGRVEYRRAKTHKLYSVKVEPEAAEIIRKYAGIERLLSLADRWKFHESFAKACNMALQNIGAPKAAPGRERKRKGFFPDLTLYWARHTWATIAAELDVPDAVIGQALGHSAACAVTDIYIRRNLRKVDEANRLVLDWVLYDKRPTTASNA